ncbi:hypothetical protein [Burkholderia cenocepacia]|uniref:hypothetical protein n=1 Tax=Burkholderia cenocepacia TaxID=95486 RepID=UPI0028B3EE41|nr:hypothetical protein [Burkholderia cenocepacia]MDT6993201.1 hypothetical protein [Burkholderia cenocepacia]
MAIPSEHDFIDCLEKIDAYPIDPTEYADRFPGSGWDREVIEQSIADNNFRLFKARNKPACEPSLQMVFDELGRRSGLIFDTVVMKWLLSSSEYTRVYARLFPNGFQLRSSEELEKIRGEYVDWAFERMCRAANVEDGDGFVIPARHYLNVRRQVFGNFGNSFRWIRVLVSAIREYHYSKSAELMLDLKRTYRERIVRAIEGIENLRSLANDDVVVRLMSHLYDGKDLLTQFKGSQGRVERVEKLIQCLSDMIEIDPDALYPISRLDSTARARVFVYRMADINWREFKSYKPAQIADLMYIEGFDVQIEQRTIERQCSSFMSMGKKYWRQVEGTRGGAAYMERLAEWRRLLDKNRK